MKPLGGLLVAAFLTVIITACGGDSESATPSATAGSATAAPSTTRVVTNATSSAPTATSTPEAATATATATTVPTNTPEPPTATPEPPTATPEPPTATPVPPTATPPPPPPPPPTATPRPATGPQSLFITAQNLKFAPTSLAATSGSNVTITLTNQDNLVPHNISVTGLGTSATCSGPCNVAVSFVAPAPGNYGFICTVHPYMAGTLVVQ